jgi:YD repeat-containing protein
MNMENRFSRIAWLVFAMFLLVLAIGCGGGSSDSDDSAGATTRDIEYTYDDLNRLTRVRYADGQVVSYTYDAAGNILSAEVVQ